MNWAKNADRKALWVLTIGALLAAVTMAVIAIVSIISDVVSGSTLVRLAVEAPIPADYFPAGLELENAIFTEAQVYTSSLSSGIVVWLNVASTITLLSQLIVALAVAYLGWRLLKGDPFRRSLTLATVIAAVALILGSAFSTGIGFIATFLAMDELTGEAFMSEGYPYTFTFDLTPALVGIALGVVATAFEYGEKLRADTAGLV